MENIVRVWTWVIVVKNWQILIGRRESKNLWYQKYGFPWGHLDFWESIFECATREVQEESNLQWFPWKLWLIGFTEDFYENKHYITFFILMNEFSWEVKALMHDEHRFWEWLTWEEIKSLWNNLFIPVQNFIKKYPDFEPNNI